MKYASLAVLAILIAACGGGDSASTTKKTASGSQEAVAKADYDALAARLEAVEKELAVLRDADSALDTELAATTSRADTLETAASNTVGRLDTVDFALSLYAAALSGLEASAATFAATDATLKSLLAAHATTLSTLAANTIALGNDLAVLDTEVAEQGQIVAALQVTAETHEASLRASSTTWLYSGSTRRHPVASVAQDSLGKWYAIARMAPGVVAQYQLFTANGKPGVNETKLDFYYESGDCTGTPWIASFEEIKRSWLLPGFGAPEVLYYVTRTSPTQSIQYNSLLKGNTFCETNVVPGATQSAIQPTVFSQVSTHTYSAPLTVGP